MPNQFRIMLVVEPYFLRTPLALLQFQSPKPLICLLSYLLFAFTLLFSLVYYLFQPIPLLRFHTCLNLQLLQKAQKEISDQNYNTKPFP